MAGNEEGQSLLVKMKEESEEADLKLNLKKKKKNKDHGIQSHHFMTKGQGKSAAMKFKDDCPLERKL